MRWSDLREGLRNFWFEYRRHKSGIFGLILLLLFIATALIGPRLAGAQASRNWRDLYFWENNPRQVPPSWVNLFSAKKLPPHEYLTDFEASERQMGANIKEVTVKFSHFFDYDEAPSDMQLLFDSKMGENSQFPTLVFYVMRPDGKELELVSKKVREARGNYTRLLLTAESSARSAVVTFAREYETQENLDKVHLELLQTTLPLFSRAEAGMMLEGSAKPLQGEYEFTAEFYLFDLEDEVGNFTLILGGKVYGLLGTDYLRRDLFTGLVWGARVSLMIGLLTSALSVSFGVFYGVMSAYFGGYKDELLQRIYEIMNSIPLLPILILLSAVFKPSVWWIVLFLTVFGWMGISKVSRSMALQIKEMDYVEAAKAVGATGWRIITKHIMPQILPYAFASMALNVPFAILYEAAISFLGLGDISRVTWGQILHDAQMSAATIKGMWWWVLPPGLGIALVGLTFVFIGSAMDEILNPKMKRL